jgi:hypothetical protein
MAVAEGLMLAGTAVSAVGSIKGGKGAQRAAEFNAQIAERNAKTAEIKAENIQRTTAWQIQDSRKEFRKLNDATQMAYRGNGWLATSGTPLKRALANAMAFEEDVVVQKHKANVASLEQEEIATNERMRGSLERMKGKIAMQTARTQAFGTLLSNAGSIYTTYKTA